MHPSARGLGRLNTAALAAAQAGHHVFPLQPRSKLPAVADWEHAATRDPAQIAEWFGARPYNPAIACGPSGLVVIDLDDGHGEAAPEPWTGATGGQEVLAMLAARGGHELARTYTVSTPTGGQHRYYRAPAGIELRNTAGALGWRIDTRARGGYVVAAGAVRDEGYYRVSDRAPIAALPQWLTAALTPPAPRPSVPEVAAGSATGGSAAGGSGVRFPPGRARGYVAAIVERVCTDVIAAGVCGPGSRHHTLLGAARTLGRLVGGDALQEGAARAALTAAATGYIGVGGYTAEQVERDITDGLAYGARMPRRVDGAHPPRSP